MVTAMEDACPNGVREEAEMTPPGQPGMAMLSTQEPDTAGGEERRRKRVGCHIVYLDEQRDTVVFDFGFNFDDEMEGLMEGFYENKKKIRWQYWFSGNLYRVKWLSDFSVICKCRSDCSLEHR